MRLLLLGVNFHPEITGVGPYNTDLCRYLVGKGHRVTAVVSAPHYPQWEVYQGYRNRLVARDSLDGVDLVRSYIYVPRQESPLGRIVYDTSFTLSSLLASLITRQRPDVILSICSPLQLGLSAYSLSLLNQAPFVFHLQDLLPDGAVALGMLRNPVAIKLAHMVASFVYRKARLISAIGQGFINALVKKGVPGQKLRVIPNWVDTEWVRPLPRGTELREQLGLRDADFVVTYIGNLGIKQAMETVAQAASILSDIDDIQFVVIGDGVRAKAVRELAQSLQLPNFHMLGVQPKARLPMMLASADLLLLHQRSEVVDMVVPSKLLTYAASQRPILFAGVSKSEGAQFVMNGDCGRVIAPENPDLMARHVVDLKERHRERARFAQNARRHVCQHFSRERVLAAFEWLLLEAADT